MLYLAALLIGLSVLGALTTLLLSVHGVWLSWHSGRRRRGMRLQIRHMAWLSDDLLHLQLSHPWRWPLPRFAAGQFLTILAQPAGSRSLRRCYSLAAWQRWPRHYQLCIKREPDGLLSNWLATHARLGGYLQVLPPAGHFTLEDRHGPHLLLIAGGVGITPMRAMLHAWCARPRARRLTLLYAGREQAGLAYHHEFLALAARHPHFSYQPALSRDTQAPPAWRGRIDSQRLAAVLEPRTQVFICAGEPLLKTTLAHLDALGVASERRHWEAFGAQTLGVGTGQFDLAWQGEALSYDGQPSLLHALHEQGVALPADCWGGHCGSCRVQCQGPVEWRQPAAVALPAGQILACCCIPTGPLVLAPLLAASSADN